MSRRKGGRNNYRTGSNQGTESKAGDHDNHGLIPYLGFVKQPPGQKESAWLCGCVCE